MSTLVRQKPSSLFRLLDLPPEVVGIVCQCLPDSGLIDIRLVCRALKFLALNAFGHRFFQEPVVILHPFSLNHLLEISRHSELSKFVKFLSVSGEQLQGSGSNPRVENRLIEMGESIRKTGLDEHMLGEAIKGLMNLKSIDINCALYNKENDDPPDEHWLRCGWGSFRTFLGGNDLESDDEGIEETWVQGQGSTGIYDKVVRSLSCAHKLDTVMLGTQSLGTRRRGCDITWASLKTPDNLSILEQSLRLPVVEPFDPKSEPWPRALKSQLRYLNFRGHAQSERYHDILQAAEQIETLHLNGNFSTWTLSHYQMGPYFWSTLRCLGLLHVTLDADTAVQFFQSHAKKLATLLLDTVALSDGGTWLGLLKILHAESQLQTLVLINLCAIASSSSKAEDFERYSLSDTDHAPHQLTCVSVRTSSLALGLLIEDYQVISPSSKLIPSWPCDSVVDFRKANAGVHGKIYWDDKEKVWKMRAEIEGTH